MRIMNSYHPQPVQLDRERIYDGHLILVNSDNPVRMSEEPVSLDETCLRELNALLEASKAQNRIVLVSGYRSREEQESIYDTSLLENGAEFTASYVARPGESDHQTGLAIDVGEQSGHVDFICPNFPDTGACKIFKQLAAEYGFIQRYKEGKEKLTGIACEPWHFRYVGFPHSVIMEQRNMCLEEYVAYIERFLDRNPYLYVDDSRSLRFYIYYVRAEAELTAVPIVASGHVRISGNNKDGFIVTVIHNQGSGSSGR